MFSKVLSECIINKILCSSILICTYAHTHTEYIYIYIYIYIHVNVSINIMNVSLYYFAAHCLHKQAKQWEEKDNVMILATKC